MTLLLVFTASLVWADTNTIRTILSKCPFNSGDLEKNGQLECGYLFVPESRPYKGGRVLRIAWAKLKSSHTANLNPMLYLSGGPGSSALTQLANGSKSQKKWLNHPLRKKRDFIFFDQRGTGFSKNDLCKGLGENFFEIASKNLSVEEETSQIVRSAVKCRKKMDNNKVDLSAYNTAASATDVDTLRNELSYKRWNLLGVSYGVRLALTIMDLYPSSVRSAVLDSGDIPNLPIHDVAIDNFMRALDFVFFDCKSDPKCPSKDLPSDFYQAIRNLEATPLVVDLASSKFVVNPQDMLFLLHRTLYNEGLIPKVPDLILAFRYKKSEVIAPLILKLKEKAESINFAQRYSVICHDSIQMSSLTEYDTRASMFPGLLGGLNFFRSEFFVCKNWHRKIGEFSTKAVVSDIPSLILSGTRDPITPPYHGSAAAKTLKNSFHFEFVNGSHGVNFNKRPLKLVERFVQDPSRDPSEKR